HRTGRTQLTPLNSIQKTLKKSGNPDTMGKIFISYSHEDSDEADAIVGIFEKLNIEYFRDKKDINFGGKIQEKVRTALHNCSAVLVTVSPASLKSSWVPYEIGQATALRKLILPYLTHPALDLPLYLSNLYQISDLSELHEFFAEHFEVSANASMIVNQLQSSVVGLADKHADFLTGKWTGEAHQLRGPYPEPIDFQIEIDLRATDHGIKGDLYIQMHFEGRDLVVPFDVSGGFVSGRFAWVNYVAKDLKEMQFGTILAGLTPNRELVGEYIGYGALTDSVVSGFSRLKKVE
ncbi:MAG: toll/interleukin-1 receptor domain-containing protein, partial [Pseudomonadota bacterium]